MNYRGLELFYLTLSCVAQVTVTSGEARTRRSQQCLGAGRAGPVPADSSREMRDTDLKGGSGEKVHV